MNNLLSDIQQNINSYSKSQKKIAKFILEQYDKAAFMTAQKLGNEVGVSESTVVRFANTLGYEGFPELQEDLREIAKNKLTTLQRYEIMLEKLGNKDILSKVINSDISNLKSTLEQIDKEDFDVAVETILHSDKIYVLGVRSSSSLASFFGFYLNLLFENVKLVSSTSASEMFEQILKVKEGDVVIGITFPRYSRRTVKALEYAKSQGASVIGITDTPQSPITHCSDISLYAQSSMVSFVDSLVAPLSLINALIVAIGMKKKGEIADTFNNLEKIWGEYNVYN